MPAEITKQLIFKPSFEYIDNAIEHGVLSPFEPKETILKAGTQIATGFKPLDCDIKMMKDVPVPMRDGVVIYVDIFLPVTADKVPVLIGWSPYGKSAGTAPRYTNLFNMLGMGNAWSSGLTKFEAPDPAYWCKHGYAVCNPDARGIADSGGNITMIGSQEAEDGHDLIEWLALQDWCNGKTALSGTSYLAFSQWFIAATCPPHLTCISPTEGLSDGYRDLAFVGGIHDDSFVKRLQINHVSKTGAMREDWTEEMQAYPFANHPVWQDKIADTSKITIPAYVVASYSNTLHTNGTFRAWRNLGSQDKWLRIHDNQEWPDYYSSESTEKLRQFFDYYLLDKKDNGWNKTPTVQYSVIDFQGGNQTDLTDEAFPPKGVENTKFYFNGKSRILQNTPENEPLAVKYLPNALPCRASFMMTFDKAVRLVGYPKVKLFMSVEGDDDLDVFVWLQKLDKFGNVLSEFVVPNRGAALQDFSQDGASVLRYKGAWGRLKASMRHLDSNKSSNEIPVHSFDRVEKLQAGQIAELDIALSPIGLQFNAGESLRLMMSSKDELGSIMPGNPPCPTNNKGIHIIHTGGDTASFVQLPVVAI